MKIFYCEQRSKQWYDLRCGKLTASNFHVLMHNSCTAHQYIMEKALERLTGKCVPNRFWTEDLQRGIDLEPVACREYELETGNKVVHVGFVQHNEYVGSSPDGLVGTEGGVEFKCPNETNFWKLQLHPKVSPQHYTQIQFNLWVCKRQWCDYIVYSTMERPVIQRVVRDEEYIKAISERAAEVNRMIDMYGKKLYYTVQKKSLKFKKPTVMSGFKVANAF